MAYYIMGVIIVRYSDLIVGVNTLVPVSNNRFTRYINFDNAATTPPFKKVTEDILRFLPYYSSAHRGMGYKSQISTDIYEKGREKVLNFVKGDIQNSNVIYVKNATEGINKLSNMIYYKDPDKIILSTDMEHHSNILPWRKFKMDFIRVDQFGRLDMKDLEYKLRKYRGKVALLAVTGASNVTGYKNPIYEIAFLCHKYGCKILVDGAQLIPHGNIDIKPIDSDYHIDYLVFSAHKMYAPFGGGALIGDKSSFKNIPPDYSGGGTVDVVVRDFVKWNETPLKDEAGTPNIIGSLALTSSIDVINTIGISNIEKYENSLLKYAYNKLLNVKEIELYIDNCDYNVSIIPFDVKGIYHETFAKILSYEYGIGVRSGCFCAQPYIQKLLNVPLEQSFNLIKNGNRRPGLIRLSFGLYNTFAEIDFFVEALQEILRNKEKLIRKFSY
ncbi:aminotransferase class V-fold PLP-dependent enzyme [Clostridium cochlearium]|uniref:Aminotransferase class V-fold PLP-dependent enzyme n=1 Tax=Clostridium cochlearium TaxID=1494 RepID=A0A7Y3V5K8_CLOCO|nr:aminotransferase class V-fold PLP-dependent enzyme [Clostridium cochlearium]MBU5268858.1 aminotransferase class V-fold PLP-dependent enzyme [Clostridium cochlearium]MCG4570930.1 aminotransferase class V-fold PLP-dependent enzyme [Clostridium cochlearium]MCR1970573.1 aminotransferase class V-fold PLP-dependent enzyme [Clostridium cochlearium]NME95401.1 aminotransferase class V-fold PLP-dependent enzyme [Clostridium cochlearium]NOH14911.1 aminotransferase class V-fold PLP-dependent enzyme [Cl